MAATVRSILDPNIFHLGPHLPSLIVFFLGNSSPAVGCRAPSSKSPSPPHQQQPQHQHHHNIHIISYDKRAAPTPSAIDATATSTDPSTGGEQPPSIAPGDNYSYVQLTAVHDFSNSFAPQPPSSGTDDSSSGQLNSGSLRRDSVGSLKKRSPIEVMGSIGGGGEGGGLNVAGRPLNKKDAAKMKLRLRCRLVHIKKHKLITKTLFGRGRGLQRLNQCLMLKL